MKNNTDRIKIYYGTPKDFPEKDKVTKRCLEIAEKAKFPTDYMDMYEHLFGNDEIELFVVMDEKNEIYGFATCNKISECSNTYINGMIIHPDMQGKGIGIRLLEEMKTKHNCHYFTARTHNPRVYEMMKNVAYNGMIYPSARTDEIPWKVWEIIASHPATRDADSNLIVREAYPDEKITQEFREKETKTIFSKLNSRDAQVIVICTRNPDTIN